MNLSTNLEFPKDTIPQLKRDIVAIISAIANGEKVQKEEREENYWRFLLTYFYDERILKPNSTPARGGQSVYGQGNPIIENYFNDCEILPKGFRLLSSLTDND